MNEHSLTTKNSTSAVFVNNKNTLPFLDTEKNMPILQEKNKKEVIFMTKAIGIDLGTTNSVVSVMEGGEPKVIINEEGGRPTPSVVAFADGNTTLVGQTAKRQAVTNPERTVFSIKRFMGRRLDEVSEEMKMVPYKVTKSENGDVRVKIDSREYAPPEISALILKKLKKAAEDYLGQR